MNDERLGRARRVLDVELAALQALRIRLGEEFGHAVGLLLACRGKVVVSGIGKSGIVCRKMAATFASTGTPAFFLHAGEASHGDLGMLVRGDVLIAVSNSGETDEVLHLLGVGVVGLLGHHVLLDPGQHAQLALHAHIELVGIVHDLLGEFDVLLVGQV